MNMCRVNFIFSQGVSYPVYRCSEKGIVDKIPFLFLGYQTGIALKFIFNNKRCTIQHPFKIATWRLHTFGVINFAISTISFNI